MKVKTLISGLLLGCIVGTALAVPTPEDRQKLCEKNPEKYVWVEKTGTCIPRNPCLSDNQTIKDSYCVVLDFLPRQNAYAFIERYVDKVLKKKIVSSSGSYDEESGHRYMSTTLSDGSFIMFSYYDPNKEEVATNVPTSVSLACEAYGFEVVLVGDTDGCKGVKNRKTCTDLADFAALFRQDVCTGTIDENKNCLITCEK